MLRQLKQLSPFQNLDQALLNTVARHARPIDLPAGRRVHSRGRVLPGRYYLLRGRLKQLETGALLAPSPQPLRLDGAATVAVTAVRLLYVDVEPVAFLFADEAVDAAAPQSDPDGWQQRFLRSHLLAPLPMRHWQQILRALTPRVVDAGERVLREGDSGAECFILAAGSAEVLRANRRLKLLVAGDFFGEDALLARAPRNATVRMLTAGRVMSLDEADFRRWLADVLIAAPADDDAAGSLQHNQRLVKLSVGAADDLRQQLAGVDACCRYQLCGPLPAARLAVFLLRQRGIRAELGDEVSVA